MPERAPRSAPAGCRPWGEAVSSAGEAVPAGAPPLCTGTSGTAVALGSADVGADAEGRELFRSIPEARPRPTCAP